MVVESRDEFGQMAESLNATQDILQTNMEKERVAAEEAFKLKTALSVANTAVLLADPEMNIVFMNDSFLQLMKHREVELKSALPAFDADKLQGQNVDVFHKQPAHQRGMIRDLKETYSTNISVAGLTLSLTATPLFDEDENRLGTVLEWEDLTEELAEQAKLEKQAEENARIKQALDNVTTNAMIADNDRRIVYMNKSVEAMLRSREAKLKEVLPNFDADSLIGETMDVFHQNPAHQQHLLEALTKTYSSEISVADLTFRLTANPVYDVEGNRIGSVVEWLDRTEEVTIEKEVNEIVSQAARGNLEARLETEGKEGFFANLAKGLNGLMDSTSSVFRSIGTSLEGMSVGDLTKRIEADYEGDYGLLKDNVNTTLDRLSEIIENIREASNTVTTGAEEIAQGNADLSQRTEEQASSLEETAASMEEMTSAVRQNGENAEKANQLASEASDKAQKGGEVVRNAVVAMSEINESSNKIADIIGVIDEIAFQTNLLALNAAVEAARAGEQGRGFAVVAGEVRSLAQRSAAAAKEIKELIRDSVDKVDAGTDLVNRSGQTLKEIVDAVERVTNNITDIANASKEQTAGIDQVNIAITEMDEMTQQNAALVEQASAAGESMAEQARGLLKQVGFFTVDSAMTSFSTPPATAPLAPPSPVVEAAPEPVVASPEIHSGQAAQVEDPDDEWEEF
jgi:methyl-accepting chemotaxis protein